MNHRANGNRDTPSVFCPSWRVFDTLCLNYYTTFQRVALSCWRSYGEDFPGFLSGVAFNCWRSKARVLRLERERAFGDIVPQNQVP